MRVCARRPRLEKLLAAQQSTIAKVSSGSWLRENSEIEFASGKFDSTSINLKNKSAGDGCRNKTIGKTILCTFRARTFSRGLGQKAKFRADQRTSALARKADVSRFMSTRPNKKLARHLRRANYRYFYVMKLRRLSSMIRLIV